MIVGVMADSHDNLTRIAQAMDALRARKCEALIHLGDFVAPFAMKAILRFGGGPVFAIYGNNDGERVGLRGLLPSLKDGPKVLELGGVKIGMAHDVKQLTPEYRETCDILLYAHTHAVEVVPAGPDTPLIVNPGETCGWLTGRATCAVMDLASQKVEILELGA